MAQKRVIVYTDDVTGQNIPVVDGVPQGEIDLTIELDGKRCKIDLSEESAEKLRELLAQYIEAGREVKPQQTRKSGQGSSTQVLDELDMRRVRNWAKSQGLPIGDRGRVPKDIRKAYLEAHAS